MSPNDPRMLTTEIAALRSCSACKDTLLIAFGLRRHPVETYVISVVLKGALEKLKQISGVSTFFAL